MADFSGNSEPVEAGMGQAVLGWPVGTGSVVCMAAGPSVTAEAVAD